MDSNTTRPPGGRADQEREELRQHFMERLKRLAHMDAEVAERADPEQRRLLDRAMSSTYWDCIRLGMRAQARKVLGLSDH